MGDPSDPLARAIWFALWCGIFITLFLYLTHRGGNNAPMRWQRWRDAFVARYFVRDEGEDTLEDMPEAVLAPLEVPDTSQLMYQAKVEALAALIRAGKIKQSEGIQIVFGCPYTQKKDSLYQQVRATLFTIMGTAPPSPFPPLTEEQKAKREELGLPPAE